MQSSASTVDERASFSIHDVEPERFYELVRDLKLELQTCHPSEPGRDPFNYAEIRIGNVSITFFEAMKAKEGA
jgi:hypothetical protein